MHALKGLVLSGRNCDSTAEALAQHKLISAVVTSA
jgi:hypothetical protein